MVKELFEKPEIEVIEMEENDVIVTSGEFDSKVWGSFQEVTW